MFLLYIFCRFPVFNYSFAMSQPKTNESDTSSATVALTKEQQERVAANRKKAKERREEALRKAGISSTSQPAAPTDGNGTDSNKRKRGHRFVDYDLSTLKDSRGGFIPGDFSDERERARRRREDEMAAERARTRVDELPFSIISSSDNPHCAHCESFDLDPEFYSVFHVSVCRSCKNELPEKYSLLTKTEVKEDYLLTDGRHTCTSMPYTSY
ncbi:hypothetical protein BDF19DRAFT_263666 [Syncephalis fuscata]|nr:hypothetical protein BDF19DRAFT_263666 [Syncephalis fuscata]